MTYDWRGRTQGVPRLNRSTRWTTGSSPQRNCLRMISSPFDRLIPYHALKGKRVLEIGCGMGLHTELMLKAGAEVRYLSTSVKPR